MKYVIAYGKGNRRRFAMRNNNISFFKTRASANKRTKEYAGYNPRIVKFKWK